MKTKWPKYVFLFLALVLLQALVFQRMVVGWSGTNYIFIIIYSQFILELPIRINKLNLLLLAFALGLSIDIFYLSPGVHAGATVFIAYIRSFVLSALEPRTGYGVQAVPSKYHMGITWYLSYASIMLFLHILTYFFLEVFNMALFFDIWIKSIFTFVVSFIFIIIYQYLFNPK